jgi:hypothetical protein
MACETCNCKCKNCNPETCKCTCNKPVEKNNGFKEKEINS